MLDISFFSCRLLINNPKVSIAIKCSAPTYPPPFWLYSRPRLYINKLWLTHSDPEKGITSLHTHIVHVAPCVASCTQMDRRSLHLHAHWCHLIPCRWLTYTYTCRTVNTVEFNAKWCEMTLNVPSAPASEAWGQSDSSEVYGGGLRWKRYHGIMAWSSKLKCRQSTERVLSLLF